MVKIGIIGGGFGESCLLPAFESIRGCKVVAVSSKRGEWRALLKRDDLDAVAIAVPPRAQYVIARAAIKKGLHVFTEKPLAVNLKQAKDLLSLARRHRVVHGIDLMFLDIPQWQKAKQVLDSKKFGPLRSIRVDWDWLSNDVKLKRWSWRTQRKEGGGALSFYFSHGLYYLEQFAGRIRTGTIVYTYAKGNPNDGEAGFELLVKFKNGAVGNIHVSSNTTGMVRHRVAMRCEKGLLVLENKNAVIDNFTLTTYTHRGPKRISVKKIGGKGGDDERVKVVRKLARRFVVACLRGAPMRPSFIDGVRVQELIDTIRRNAI